MSNTLILISILNAIVSAIEIVRKIIYSGSAFFSYNMYFSVVLGVFYIS
jgi:hypothetical protein